MKNNDIDKLIRSIDRSYTPPPGVKEKILAGIIQSDMTPMSPLERLIFIKPFRAACVLAAAISGLLWGLMGNSYSNIILNFMGNR